MTGTEYFALGFATASIVWGVGLYLLWKNNRRKFGILKDEFKKEAKEKAEAVLSKL